ncbi:hypothetical protein [Marinobacter sp. SS21]|uniref:hypothetical protein n=1 Tax=Marinobacter sp. SS21 TaxID=2979460 RepID=UPI00232BBCA1|nr:hypothetical protein [Marinobacter sp. SS21]MDC0662800.1 hypothetical protein [Marinobacter sp. SS21]
MESDKLMFWVLFFIVAAFNFWFDLYASHRVTDKRKQKILLANPLWFLVRGLFSKEHVRIRFIGGGAKLLLLVLFFGGIW